MSNEPLTISIKGTDDSVYSDLLKSEPLKGKSNKEIFLLAMVLGYNSGKRISIKGDKQSYVRTEYLNEDDKALINSIAINEEKTAEILCDKKKVYEIAEEYAHVGIKILREMIDSKGSFLKKLEAELRDKLEVLEIKDEKENPIS